MLSISKAGWSFIDYAVDNGIDIHRENIDVLVKGWLLHCKYLSYYALGEQHQAMAQLDRALGFGGLPRKFESTLLIDLCHLSNQFSLWDRMRQALAKLKSMATEIGSELGLALVEYFEAAILISEGHYQEAIGHYQQALFVATRARDDALAAEILNDIGFCYRRLDDDNTAEEYYRESLRIKRKLGYLLGEAESLNNLGLLLYDKKMWPQAEEALQRALEIEFRIGDRMGAGYTLVNLGFIKKNQKCYPEAVDLYQRALRYREDMSDHLGMAYCYCQLAHLAEELGNYGQALDNVEQAILNFNRSQDLHGILESNLTKADILWHLNRGREARELLEKIEDKITAGESSKLRVRYREIKNKLTSGSP